MNRFNLLFIVLFGMTVIASAYTATKLNEFNSEMSKAMLTRPAKRSIATVVR